jgi:hypothetical protein
MSVESVGPNVSRDILQLWRTITAPRVVTPSEPVVPEDEERVTSRCSCLVCADPERYMDPRDVAKRTEHLISHRSFDVWLRERDIARLRGVE